MVSFKDGSSSASDADIIRTQIESLMEIMLVQVKQLFHFVTALAIHLSMISEKFMCVFSVHLIPINPVCSY